MTRRKNKPSKRPRIDVEPQAAAPECGARGIVDDLIVTYPGAGIDGADLVIVNDPPKGCAELRVIATAPDGGFGSHIGMDPGKGDDMGVEFTYKNGTVSVGTERRALRVYVAGASADIPRARKAMALLGGVEPRGLVTHDWPAAIVKERVCDNDKSKAQCERAALDDLRGVAAADVLWLLLPTVPTTGAWFEAGAAWAHGKRIIVSGRRVGIFWALGEHFATDALAAAAILESASERLL